MATTEAPRPTGSRRPTPPPARRSTVTVPPARTGTLGGRLLVPALLRLVPRLHGALRVTLPDGRVLHTRDADAEAPTLEVRDDRFLHRLVTDGKIGLGEGYMAGEWDSDDLPGVLAVLGRNVDRVPVAVHRAVRAIAERVKPHEPNDLHGAASNVRRHYDLSNELFATFLDPTLTYSSAIFEPGDTLERAQLRKYDALIDLLDLGADHHLLEVGTGWGSMAMRAAATTGCHVTTITLSREQHALATQHIAAAGLDDRIQVLLRDYREVEGTYDRIVSIEMFEAVGEEFWETFFRSLAARLVAGGRLVLQTITMPDRRWQAGRGGYGWINKYIFPGGEIPSLAALDAPIRAAGLVLAGRRDIGPHYAETLRRWRENFTSSAAEVGRLGFDLVFRRMWEFYLAYCEAGFRAGALDDTQLLLTQQGST